MNALQKAGGLLATAELLREKWEREPNAYDRSAAEAAEARAAIYAHVAAAEALTRLAEVAEELLAAGELSRAAAIWGQP